MLSTIVQIGTKVLSGVLHGCAGCCVHIAADAADLLKDLELIPPDIIQRSYTCSNVLFALSYKEIADWTSSVPDESVSQEGVLEAPSSNRGVIETKPNTNIIKKFLIFLIIADVVMYVCYGETKSGFFRHACCLEGFLLFFKVKKIAENLFANIVGTATQAKEIFEIVQTVTNQAQQNIEDFSNQAAVIFKSVEVLSANLEKDGKALMLRATAITAQIEARSLTAITQVEEIVVKVQAVAVKVQMKYAAAEVRWESFLITYEDTRSALDIFIETHASPEARASQMPGISLLNAAAAKVLEWTFARRTARGVSPVYQAVDNLSLVAKLIMLPSSEASMQDRSKIGSYVIDRAKKLLSKNDEDDAKDKAIKDAINNPDETAQATIAAAKSSLPSETEGQTLQPEVYDAVAASQVKREEAASQGISTRIASCARSAWRGIFKKRETPPWSIGSAIKDILKESSIDDEQLKKILITSVIVACISVAAIINLMLFFSMVHTILYPILVTVFVGLLSVSLFASALSIKEFFNRRNKAKGSVV